MTKGTTNGVTKAQIKQFRTVLEAKAEEIQTSLGSSKAAKALDRGEDPPALEDLPVQSHEEWIFLNRNNIDVMLFREIEEALVRVDDGGYGICPECNDPISIKRLQAVPWALYCVTCQEELSEEPQQRRRRMRSYSY